MSAQPAPSNLAELLPRRHIAVRLPPAAEGGTISVIMMLLVLLGGVVAWLAPAIVSDWRMREDAVAATDLRVRDARCHSWLAALKFCNVALVAAKGDDAGERTLWYVFLGGADDQAMTPLRSGSDASHVTTGLGLEKVHSRLITLLLFAAIVVLCIGVAAAMLRRGREARRAFSAMSGQRLEPVVVEIERNNLVPPRRRLWVYLYQEGGRRERALAEWPSRQQPLFTSLDEKSALAIRGEEGGRPMLLDVNLQCLDLTDAERAAFRVAFLARFGARAGGTAAV
jgi:hypothetical protein